MPKVRIYKTNRLRRKARVRSKLKGTNESPRLSVYRSNKYIYAQLINDVSGKTLVSVSDKGLEKKGSSKIESALNAGKELAEKALEKGIKSAVFDRGGYKFHGRIKSLAEGARQAGLRF